MSCHPSVPVVSTANFFLSRATPMFSAWEGLRLFRTRNFSPYSPLHNREIILATTSSAQEKSIEPIPEKSRTMRSGPFASPKIFSRASRIRMPRDRPVISFDPFLRTAVVSFFKERIRFSILLFQLIQLNQLIIKLIFCQVIFVDFLGEAKSSGQWGVNAKGNPEKIVSMQDGFRIFPNSKRPFPRVLKVIDKPIPTTFTHNQRDLLVDIFFQLLG